MKKLSVLLAIMVVFGLVIAACGGGSGGSGSEAGKNLFNQSVIGTNPGCVTCHSLEKGVTIVGPSLAGIATHAAAVAHGQSAEEFIKESITDPNAHIAEGFTASIMPQNWSKVLSEEQIDQLVDYLLTLK